MEETQQNNLKIMTMYEPASSVPDIILFDEHRNKLQLVGKLDVKLHVLFARYLHANLK